VLDLVLLIRPMDVIANGILVSKLDQNILGVFRVKEDHRLLFFKLFCVKLTLHVHTELFFNLIGTKWSIIFIWYMEVIYNCLNYFFRRNPEIT
jgi:hypothetical protein